MTLAAEHANRTLNTIVETLGLDEVPGDDSDLRLPLKSDAFGDVGSMRVFTGKGVSKVVYIGMTVAPIGLDSHMIFAFTPDDSLVPHFTLDSVSSQDFFAFHLDLMSKADVAANLDYVDAVFGPLSDAYESAGEVDGLSKAHLNRRQWALMSPWMLAHRATAEAFEACGPVIDAYRDHWISLLDTDIPAPADGHGSPSDIGNRDRLHRAALFSPDVDPVWHRVEQLLGAEVSEELRTTLASPEKV
ncbi:MAG: hypothetical protein ACR2N2_11595 [Acidimicrobiia bacterium]